MAAPHQGLIAERWARFPRAQQILMIANEMNRASKLFGPADPERLRGGHERVLALANLTIQVTGSRSLHRDCCASGISWPSSTSHPSPTPLPMARASGPCCSSTPRPGSNSLTSPAPPASKGRRPRWRQALLRRLRSPSRACSRPRSSAAPSGSPRGACARRSGRTPLPPCPRSRAGARGRRPG